MRPLILRLASAVLLGLLVAGEASAAPRSPTCTPASLNGSAVLGGRLTVSPAPGSRDATPQTQISLRGLPARQIRGVSVVGSATGSHAGRLLGYSQGDGASFVPARPFAQGERVQVRVRLRIGGRVRTVTDGFAVARRDEISSTPERTRPGNAAQVQSFRSRPDLRPPVVAVSASSPLQVPGDVFAAPYGGPGQAGPMILDPAGRMLWFKRLPTHVSATNLQVQQYQGRPVLTWWEGNISVHGFGKGTDVIVDGTYTKVAQVKAGNGLQADLHDFQLTPSGTALITAYEPILCDLSSVGGPARGALTDGVVQEIDVRTGLVRMQWTSLDHVALGESYSRASSSSLAFPYDYFHVNSIAVSADSLLLSARNTWAVYDVDAASGRIVWRLGGRNSTFREGAPARTAWQHDPRVVGDGLISIFDNGAAPGVHGQSRGVLLSLSAGGRSATLVQQLTHVPPLVADSQGSLQLLPGGGWFVGWGQVPFLSEFGPEGALLFDAHFPPGDQSYRGFRFPWTGRPRHSPSLAFLPAPGGGGTAYASWNGATDVSAWRLLAGASAASLTAVTVVPRTGFETAIALSAASAGPYVAVEALDSAGATLGVSVPHK